MHCASGVACDSPRHARRRSNASSESSASASLSAFPAVVEFCLHGAAPLRTTSLASPVRSDRSAAVWLFGSLG
jgi:hypothetical protein